MLFIISYFLVPFGLGQLLSNLLKMDSKKYGVNTYLGFCLIPILALLFNVTVNVELSLISIGTHLLGGFGFVLFLLKNKSSLMSQFKGHPIFFALVPFLILFCIFHRNFYAYSWDEFSHWLTMPRQIFKHNMLSSSDFLIKGFASYTPGWPYLLLFKDFAFSKIFNLNEVLIVPILSGLFLVLSCYDILVDFKKTRRVSLSIAALLPFLAIPYPYFPKNTLIEIPMSHFVVFFFLYFSWRYIKGLRLVDMAVLGLSLGYAYTLKHAFITILPIAFFFCLLFLYKNLKFENDRKRIFLKFVISVLLIFTPFFLLKYIWGLEIAENDIKKVFRPALKSLEDIFALIEKRSTVLPMGMTNFFKAFFRGNLVGAAGSIVFFYTFIKKKEFRILCLLPFLYYAGYFLSLIWMYLTSFGEYEASYLASFYRYMSIPLSPIQFMGVTLLLITIFDNKKVEDLINRVVFTSRLDIRKLSYLFVVIFLGLSSLKFKLMRSQKRHLSKEAPSFISEIKKRGVKFPNVQVIRQGGNDFELHVARFESIQGREYVYNVLSYTSWSDKRDNVWRKVVSRDEMVEHLIQNVDVIWPIQSDKWLDNILKEEFQIGEICYENVSAHFLFKVDKKKFECVKK